MGVKEELQSSCYGVKEELQSSCYGGEGRTAEQFFMGVKEELLSSCYWGSRVQSLPKPSDFSGRKNSQHAFLRNASNDVRPMSHICGM